MERIITEPAIILWLKHGEPKLPVRIAQLKLTLSISRAKLAAQVKFCPRPTELGLYSLMGLLAEKCFTTALQFSNTRSPTKSCPRTNVSDRVRLTTSQLDSMWSPWRPAATNSQLNDTVTHF